MRALAGLIVFLGCVVGGAPGQGWGVRPDGTPAKELAPPGARAVVLFFVASDCPVSNRMFPEMRRLREEFVGSGVRTWFVYPNTYEKAAEVARHQQDFDAGGDALQDPSGALVRFTHAVATPEMVVLVPAGQGWRVVYAGKIDNRYLRLGVERPAATVHYGEDALKAVVAGRAPKAAEGVPVGCAIANPGVRGVGSR